MRSFPLEFFMRPDFFDYFDDDDGCYDFSDDEYNEPDYNRYREPEPTRYYKPRKKKKKKKTPKPPPQATNEEYQELVDAIFKNEPLSTVQEICQYLTEDGYNPIRDQLTQVRPVMSLSAARACQILYPTLFFNAVTSPMLACKHFAVCRPVIPCCTLPARNTPLVSPSGCSAVTT